MTDETMTTRTDAASGTEEDDTGLSDTSLPAGTGGGPMFELLEGLNEAYLIADTRGKLRYANQSARQLLGLKGRVAGRNLPHILSDKNTLQLVDEAAGSLRPRSGTVSLTLSRAGTEQFNIAVHPLRPAGEEWLLRIALSKTENQKPEADVAQDPAQAAGLEKLSDPLSIIQGYLENLLDGVIRDPVVMRQCLGAMQRQTSQIQRILGGLKR